MKASHVSDLVIKSSGVSYPWIRAKAGLTERQRPSGAIWKIPSVGVLIDGSELLLALPQCLRSLSNELLKPFLVRLQLIL